MGLKKYVLLFLLFSLGFSLRAQKLSSDPTQFIADVKTMLANSKNASAIEVGENFGSLWAGSFSDAHRTKIIETTLKMVKSKKLRVNPDYANYFAILIALKQKNFPEGEIDSLLLVSDKSIEKLEGRQMGAMFATIRMLLEKEALFVSNYNRLHVRGGSFTLRYITAQEDPSVIDIYNRMQDDAEEDEWDKPKSIDDRKADFFSDWDDASWEEDNWDTPEELLSESAVLKVGYLPPPQPKIDGPVIEFKNVDLHFATAWDSTALRGTEGSLMLMNHLFVGKGGAFDWTVAGFNSSELYCEFKEYNFPVKSTRLIAEGAMLHYPAKCDSVIEGIFQYNSKKHKNFEDNEYPRFKSFDSDVDVKGLGDNILYKGGFSLAGRKMYSSSVDEGKATIQIQRDGITRIKTISAKFELGDSLISANFSSITVYIENDSITHPGVNFKYNKNTNVLRCAKQSGYRNAAFLDTYHKLDITADVLIWDMNGSGIDFNITNARDQVPATFESEEYFNGDKYAGLQGMYRFHPLQMLVGHCDKVKSDECFADELAKAYKQEPVTVRGAMVHLMKNGFIDYNIRSGHIKLRPKARHYVLSRRDKKDYDNITFISISPKGTSATLDLTTNELTVRGVDKIQVSDSLKVDFEPDNREIRVLKNRDFSFDGKINTQNFQFIGENFVFNYDSFLVHMHDIDAIKMRADKDAKSAGKANVLGNDLRYSAGTLYINEPNNKSARKSIPEYPIFDAIKGATVFFDSKDIAGGAYDTTLQFKIPPFHVDSLSSDNPEAIGFDGEFNSGGIFPPFKERLVVMPDRSLGFNHKVPSEGFQLYEGEGKYFGKITLNNQGLRGDGEIQFYTSTLYSNEFVYFKDSVLTEGSTVVTKPGPHPNANPGVTFPDMMVNEYRMKWYPILDSMFISNLNSPFDFYDKTASLQGTINITKKGMLGLGVLFTRGSESMSLQFKFEKTRYSGREAVFLVKSDNPSKPVLSCDNVKLEFDLEKEIAYFSPEIEGAASNEFPYAQYKSSLDKGVWDLNKKTITMSMPEGGDISKSYFYSTRKDQDSLVFNATEGIYDIEKLTLNVYGIPYITVADGKIIPNGNKIAIYEDAVIRTLKKAKIVMDTINELHHMFDGTIDIISRKKFMGEASYEYVNSGSDTLSFKFQQFVLSEPTKKRDAIFTIAAGAIREDDSLMIAPRILYKGKVTMHANKPNLMFDGYVSIVLKGSLNYGQWIKYENNGEKKEVVINLETARADNGQPLSTGLHYDNKGNKIYPTFVSQKNYNTDPDFFTATGFLEYNPDSNEFVVGRRERISEKSYQGNIFYYNDSRSTFNCSGKFTFLEDNPNIKLLASGYAEGNPEKEKYFLNQLLAFSYKPIHASILTAMGKNLKQVAMVMPPDTLETMEVIERRELDILYKLAEIVGDDGVKSYRQKRSMSYTPLLTLHKNISGAVVFSDVNLKWSPEYKAFYSVGNIYVSNFLKEDVNKPVNGFIEIRKTPKGDVVTIYLEPTPSNWYFITYDDNRFAAVTGNQEINAVIGKRSKGEMMDRSKPYFVQADLMEKMRFLRGFNERYLGNEMEEEIMDEPEPDDPEPDAEEPGDDVPADEPDASEEEEEEYVPKPKKAQTQKKSKEDKRNFDKYKLPAQNTDFEEKQEKKDHPTLEDRKKAQQDQQRIKDLLK